MLRPTAMATVMVTRRREVQRQLTAMKKMEKPNKNLRWRMKLKKTK